MSSKLPLAPRWATMKEAAEYSGFNEVTLRRWISAGRLPAHRLGPRRLMVDLNEIDRLRVPVPTAKASGQ